MIRYLYKLYHPEIYQGHANKRNYFEGWYFKIVDQDESNAFAIIPGVSIGREKADHAFIQVLDGIQSKAYYYDFPPSDFQADKNLLDIRIGNNHFSKQKIKLDLPALSGHLEFSDLHPIPTSLLRPGIMGWYSFTPAMECYHGIVSMHHKINGQLQYDDKNISMDEGRGYLEKDWGTSFPKCWVWTHSNHFEEENEMSMFASIAHIPWMGSYFVGFIVTLLFRGETIIFATYNGSKKKLDISHNEVIMAFKKGNKTLEVKATPGMGAPLKSPIQGMMTGKVNESLQAVLKVTYRENHNVLYQGKATTAGLEVAGNTEILTSDSWKSR